MFTQPIEELHESDAVFQHRRPKTRYLRLVLDGLHPFDGRLFLHDFRLWTLFLPYHLVKCIVHLVGIEKDVILKIIFQTLLHILIGIDPYLFGFQVIQNLGRQLLLIYI